MKALGTLMGMILGLALLVALLVGGYFLIRYIASVYDTLEPQVKTVTAIASVVAVVCAAIIAGGLRANNPNDGGVSRKAREYERLALFCADRLKMETEEQMNEKELVELEQLLALYGSHKVITAYMELRQAGRKTGKEDSEASLSLLNNLVVAMRADLGRRELNIKERDLLDLLLGRG